MADIIKNEKLMTCGQFAKKSRTPKKTIIYYDEFGILHPYYVAENGYRYYASKQLVLIENIKALQLTGLSLTEIKNILEVSDYDELSNFLSERISCIEEKINELNETKKALQKTIGNITNIKEQKIGRLFYKDYDDIPLVFSHSVGEELYEVGKYEISGGIIDTEINERKPQLFFHSVSSHEEANAVIDASTFVCGYFQTIFIGDAIEEFRKLCSKQNIRTDTKYFFIDQSNGFFHTEEGKEIHLIMARLLK